MPKNAIQAIINRRNQKAEDFAKRKEAYEEINKRVINIIRYKEQMLNEDFQDATNRKLAGDNFIGALSNLNKSSFDETYHKLKNSLNEVIRIYEKDEINISVIGVRRQGKSQLLQSISGLKSEIIPTSEKEDCTGAISVIKNQEGTDVKVQIKFYTEQEMITNINAYIREIKSPLLNEVMAMSEVKDLRINEVINAYNADQSKASLLAKCKQLAKYVNNYDTWSFMVEKYGNANLLFEVNNVSDIVKYVAQHNGKLPLEPGYEAYYYYLAVKEAQIACQFNYSDAGKIVLRDTIGFGDTKSVGLLDSMVKSVSEGCDAAIVVKRPENIGGTQFEESDNLIYDALQQSAKERQLNMEDWCFYFLNHVEGTGDNLANCEYIKHLMESENRANASVYIANASKPEEVTNKFLIPMLGILKENLPRLDAALEARIEAEAEAVYNEYEKICAQCAEALSYSYEVKQNFENENRIGFSKRWDKAIVNLDMLSKEYKNIVNEPCERFQQAVMALRPVRSSTGIVPPAEKIQASLKSGMRPQALLPSYMDKLRNDFTKKFVQMDDIMSDLVANMQKKVCDIMVNDFSLNKIVSCTPEDYGNQLMAEQGLEEMPKDIYAKWLAKLYTKLKELFKNSTKYDDLFVAIKFISTFTISVRGFLMHKVRSSVNNMDPVSNTNPGANLNRELTRLNNMSISEEEKERSIAQVIHNELVNLSMSTFERIYEKIKDMFKDPNQLLYSAVAEFVDRIRYSYYEEITGRITWIEQTWKELYEEKEFREELEQTYNKLQTLQGDFRAIVDNKLSKAEFFSIK